MPEQVDRMHNIERTERMTQAEFDAWADTIDMPAAIRAPVLYVIDREYSRGAATAKGAVEVLKVIRDRPTPDGNASCATELQRVKKLAADAITGGQ